MATLQSQLDELQKFECSAPDCASRHVIKTTLPRAALVCVVLLLSTFSFAQEVVSARATIPFSFWAQGQEFQAGDYVFDSGFPGSTTIHRDGSNSSVAIPIILYVVPVDRENAKLLFLRREGKYFLVEIWGVGGRRVLTSEFQHRGQVSEQQREVPLTLVHAAPPHGGEKSLNDEAPARTDSKLR